MELELHQRWLKSKSVVIGCSYNNEEVDFWTQLDKFYIGIGFGETSFHGDPFNANWNTTHNFWENDTVKPYYGTFENVYLDRCVWNCFADSVVFSRMIRFVAGLLKPNGRFYIPFGNWNTAIHYVLQQMFYDIPAHKKSVYEVSDTQNIDAMVKSKMFRLGSTFTYEQGKDSHRYKWQIFYRL